MGSIRPVARQIRIEFAGAAYHVVTRGNRLQAVFDDDEDRQLFLRTLGEICSRTRWQVQGYCLMPDHIHLVLVTPEPNLVTGMKWLLGTYAARTNRRHQLKGHLFSSRYKSMLLEAKPPYLPAAVDYVHLNPARANLISRDQPLSEYRWSSLPVVLSTSPRRPSWLRVDSAFGGDGRLEDTATGRKRLAARMETLRAGAEPAEFAHFRRGWCFGSERFRTKLLARVNQRRGARAGSYYGPEWQEAAEARAEAIVLGALKKLHWKEEDLVRRTKGDVNKVGIARRLREESSVTLDWIAHRLRMGARTYLAHLLYWDRRRGDARGSKQLAKPSGKERKERRAASSTILLTDPSARAPAAPVSEIGFDPSFD